MKKLQTALHYIVFILIITVIIFSAFYIYNKSNEKNELQYKIKNNDTFYNEILKIKKEINENEKQKIEVKKPIQTLKQKTEIKKPIQTLKQKTEIKKPTQTLKQKTEVKKPTQTLKQKTEIKKPIQTLKQKTEKIYNPEILYNKHCKICHGNLVMFLKKTNKNRLSKLFLQNAKELSLIHEKSNVSKMTNKYFKSNEYKLQINTIGKYIIKRKENE